MAFGDSSRAQNQIDYQSGTAQNQLNNLRTDTVVPQNQTMWNQYLTANDQDRALQGDILGGYKGAAGAAQGMFAPVIGGFAGIAGGTAGGFDPQFRGGLGSALGGYQDFARTGGYSPQAIQDLRARSVAPMRAVYQNAMSDIDRQKSLQGGYAPNAIAARTKLARNLGQGLSDQATNIEAGLAEQIRSGQLAGLGGGAQTSTQGQGLQNAIDSLNSQSRLAALTGMGQTTGLGMDAILRSLGGATSLYGAEPGLAGLASKNVASSTGHQIDVGQLQNQLSLGTEQNQINKGQIPGNFAQGLSAVTGVMNALPGVGGFLNGIRGGGNQGGVAGIPGRTPNPTYSPVSSNQFSGFDNTLSGPTSQPPRPNVTTSETYQTPGSLTGYDNNGNSIYGGGSIFDPHEYSTPDNGNLPSRQTVPNYGTLPTGGMGLR